MCCRQHQPDLSSFMVASSFSKAAALQCGKGTPSVQYSSIAFAIVSRCRPSWPVLKVLWSGLKFVPKCQHFLKRCLPSSSLFFFVVGSAVPGHCMNVPVGRRISINYGPLWKWSCCVVVDWCRPQGCILGRLQLGPRCLAQLRSPHRGDVISTELQMALYMVVIDSLCFPNALPASDFSTLFLPYILRHSSLAWYEKFSMLYSTIPRFIRSRIV